jgi:predicted GIY-YIG superfamily endonuclease
MFRQTLTTWPYYNLLKLKAGITANVEKRLKQHGSPELLYKEGPYERQIATNRERQIKKWSRIKKARLIQEGQES